MLDINGSIYYNGVKVNGGTMKSQAMVVRDAPAALVAGSIWYQPIREFILESQAAIAAGQNEVVTAPDAVIWAWLCYAVIYTVWCTVFEILWGATPGKRLMGCEVRRESFGEPFEDGVEPLRALGMVHAREVFLVDRMEDETGWKARCH